MRITAGGVTRWSVAACVVCIALWNARAVPITQGSSMQAPVRFVEPAHVMSAPETTVLNVDLVQTVAVISRLCAPGAVERVELSGRQIGCSPIIIVTTRERSGNIRKDFVVLEGLVIEEVSGEGIVLIKPNSTQGVEF